MSPRIIISHAWKSANNAFLERSYGSDLLAAATNHLLRLSSDSQTLVVSNRNGYHAGLVNYYLILIHNEGVGGAKVYCNLLRKGEKSHS